MKFLLLFLLVPLVLLFLGMPVDGETVKSKSVGTQSPHIVLVASDVLQSFENFTIETDINGKRLENGLLVIVETNTPTQVVSWRDYLVLLEVTGVQKTDFQNHSSDYTIVNNGYVDKKDNNKILKFPMGVISDSSTGYIEDKSDLNNIRYSIPDDISQRINIVISAGHWKEIQEKLQSIENPELLPVNSPIIDSMSKEFLNQVVYYDSEGNKIDFVFVNFRHTISVANNNNGIFEQRDNQSGECYIGYYHGDENFVNLASSQANVFGECFYEIVKDRTVNYVASSFDGGHYRALISLEPLE